MMSCARSHHLGGPKASHALTFKLDHSSGAAHYVTAAQSCRWLDIFDQLLAGAFAHSSYLSHVQLLSGYDEPTTLSYQILLFGPISADVRHMLRLFRRRSSNSFARECPQTPNFVLAGRTLLLGGKVRVRRPMRAGPTPDIRTPILYYPQSQCVLTLG